jgi:hypothetical protein
LESEEASEGQTLVENITLNTHIEAQVQLIVRDKQVIIIIILLLLLSIGERLFFQKLRRGGGLALMRLSFQRFFGLPRLPTPCGRLPIAIFARQLSSILPTWASHSLLRTWGPFNYVLNST